MSSIMKYRGYYTKVQYSDEDRVLFGVIEGIDDSISFEGESVQELENAFHEAVEDYLDICKRMGKEPQKAYKGSFNVRITSQLHRQAAEKAAEQNTTLNDFVEKAIEHYIEYFEYGDETYFVGHKPNKQFKSLCTQKTSVGTNNDLLPEYDATLLKTA